MKNIINKSKVLVSAMLIAVMALTSCYQKFEESWDLAINTNNITFPYEEGSISIACFTTGHWTARLDRDIAWGHLENTSGNGTGYVKFIYDLNTSVSRSVDLILEAQGKKEIIHLVQRTGIGEGAVSFDRDAVTYANGKYEGRLEIQTNLPDVAFAEAAPILTAPEGATASLKEAAEGTEGEEPETPAIDWVTDVVYHPAEVTGTDEEGKEIKSKPYITFVIQPNTTGADREAVMKYGLTDAAGTEYYAVATLTQEAANGYIILNDITVTRDEQVGVKVAVETNLTEFIDDMVTEVSYQSDAKDYVNNVVMTSAGATFDIAANPGVKRIAIVKVSYTDLDGNKTEGSLRVIQRGETIKRVIPAVDIRKQLTAAGDFVYASVSDDTGDYADVLELRVITDASSQNNETNPNTAWNKIDANPNATTGYAQSEDGKAGFRLQFVDAASNVLKGFSKIELPLDGKKIVREDNPTRYTITGLTDKDIVLVSEGTVADLASKNRTISTLTDEDVYTYVTLTDTELAVKNAPYTYNVESMVLSFGKNTIRDELASMVTDKDHKAIFALINSKCEWRRDITNGTITAPAGVGTTSGVIVHSKNVSYGNIGTYQIRPLDQSSFNMSTSEAYTTNVLAAWRLTLETVSVGKYKWNDGGAFVYAKKEVGQQANFNKMHPTHGEIKDYSASLYSTNRTVVATHNVGYASESKTSLHNQTYHPTIVDGCKSIHKTWTGTTNNDPTCCSKASALGFWGDVASYYEWTEQGDWTGKTNGIVMEFPATTASGKMSVQFSMGSLAYGRTDNANKLTMPVKLRSATFGFPLYWKVECSIDGGNTWTACTNAVNGEQQFKMNPTMHYLDGKSYEITDFLTSVKIKPQTPLEHCPGFVQQKFILPAHATGAAKVMLKISPASLRLAAYSGVDYKSAIDVPGHDCTKSYSYSHALVLEDVVVSYK